MNDFIEKLLARPKGQLMAGWIGSLMLLTYIFWAYLYGPVAKSVSENQEKLQKTSSEIATETRLVNNLEKYRREVAGLVEKFEIAKKQLPDQREIPNLLSSVSSLAKESGLIVSRFAPGAEVSKDFYSEIPVDIEMKGTYHKVATFFDEVSRLSRIVNIRDVVISEPGGSPESLGVQVNVKGQVVTFRYVKKDTAAIQSDIDKAKRK